MSGHRLVLIEGRAGSGKSAVLAAIRGGGGGPGAARHRLGTDEQRRTDYMRASGFTRAATVHSLLWYRATSREHANAQIPRGALIAVDEAAMLDVQRYRELLKPRRRRRPRSASSATIVSFLRSSEVGCSPTLCGPWQRRFADPSAVRSGTGLAPQRALSLKAGFAMP